MPLHTIYQYRPARAVYLLVLIVSLGPLLAACPKTPTTVPEAGRGDIVAPMSAATAGAPTNGGQVRALAGSEPLSVTAAEISVFFDYDSDRIKPEATRVIATQANRLATEPRLQLRLEGNTDERGSAEYNVGLGERRAQAVKRALMLQGARASQLTTVSYGSERPLIDGHEESAWARNRRVDVVDAK